MSTEQLGFGQLEHRVPKREVFDLTYKGREWSVVVQENQFLLPYTKVYLTERGKDVPVLLADRSDGHQFGNSMILGCTALQQEQNGLRAWEQAVAHAHVWVATLQGGA